MMRVRMDKNASQQRPPTRKVRRASDCAVDGAPAHETGACTCEATAEASLAARGLALPQWTIDEACGALPRPATRSWVRSRMGALASGVEGGSEML